MICAFPAAAWGWVALTFQRTAALGLGKVVAQEFTKDPPRPRLEPVGTVRTRCTDGSNFPSATIRLLARLIHHLGSCAGGRVVQVSTWAVA